MSSLLPFLGFGPKPSDSKELKEADRLDRPESDSDELTVFPEGPAHKRARSTWQCSFSRESEIPRDEETAFTPSMRNIFALFEIYTLADVAASRVSML